MPLNCISMIQQAEKHSWLFSCDWHKCEQVLRIIGVQRRLLLLESNNRQACTRQSLLTIFQPQNPGTHGYNHHQLQTIKNTNSQTQHLLESPDQKISTAWQLMCTNKKNHHSKLLHTRSTLTNYSHSPAIHNLHTKTWPRPEARKCNTHLGKPWQHWFPTALEWQASCHTTTTLTHEAKCHNSTGAISCKQYHNCNTT